MGIVETIAEWAQQTVGDYGLPAVFVLMALESMCIPIPSGVTTMFAGLPRLAGRGGLLGGRDGRLGGRTSSARGSPGRPASTASTRGGKWDDYQSKLHVLDYPVLAALVAAAVWWGLRMRRRRSALG